MKISLQHVQYMPKDLQPGVLYVAREFGAVAHLCACGCGSKIRTPLSPTEWDLEETEAGPSLYPSIGNWQRPCQSHYWILRGEIIWAEKWTPEQIAAGRQAEERRRRDYYDALDCRHDGLFRRFWRWLTGLFRK